MMRLVETSRLFSLGLMLLGLCSGLCHANEAQYHAYFTSRLTASPEPFVVSGLTKIPRGEGRVAIDLGSGVGLETKLLLDKGYNVIAVDRNPMALEYMRKIPGISKHLNNLKTVSAQFEHLNFANLPRADLILSSFALPLVNKNNFNAVWRNVTSQIKPGGYILVNLYDPNYAFYKNKQNMTFHTQAEAKALFNGFDIIEFKAVKNQYYAVVAKKR